MPKISIKNIFLFAIAFLVFIILLKFLSDWSFPDTSWPLEKGEKVKMETSQPLVQKFTASRDGLERIKVLFANSSLGDGGILEMKIYDETCSQLLRESSLKVTSLDSGNIIDFTFSRIPNSKDKSFCLNLAYKPQKGAKSANIFLLNNPSPQSQFLSLNGQERPGQSIAMRPAYQNSSLWQNIVELDRRMSQYKPWFLKSYYLLIIAFLFIFFSILSVILLIL